MRAAARALGVGAPAVSHRLKALEKTLGVALFVRTTRSIELTEAGRTLLAGAAPAFQEIIDAIEGTRAIGGSTTGTLRLTMPISAFKMIVAPVLAEFQTLYYPRASGWTCRPANGSSISSRRDFTQGFRLGDRLTPGVVAVRPDRAADALLISPRRPNLQAHGRPAHPRDLLGHKCIRYRYITANRIQDWQFIVGRTGHNRRRPDDADTRRDGSRPAGRAGRPRDQLVAPPCHRK